MTQVTLETLIQGALAGKIISFPTDTVPALAVKPELAELIFQAKQRRQDKPLILMTATIAEIWDYVVGSPTELEIWQQVAAKYLPGALTLVLPSSPRVPATMNPQEPTTIGVRVPNLELAQTILQQTGPLATTSANLSGQPPLMTIPEINAQFPQVLTLTPDFDTVSIGKPSTVIKWDNGQWQILRQGSIEFNWEL
ncbi:L-threonylcarbamoyladenylate synthase [Calothrix sp. NIES-3974]|uniref:L-threonylcarbamoyladenylate synthase n=1 Tax=Calothrix sp. NIES-3974 TaxID=2005462 RepID=UPI000B617CB7|nr:L-threonylcarbamoyladenylate synthase [Calothrix sp. NIES-3974]BAZ07362.1 SUA5/yciO/yrdC domain-containing protein [Calothrix sp. NIES-3974]